MRAIIGNRRAFTLWAALLAAVVLVCAGCGSTSVKSRLQNHLLSATDLPAGWTKTSASDNTKLANAPCLASLTGQPKGWTYQSVTFYAGAGVPSSGETLASGANVLSTWRHATSALDSCHTAQLKIGNREVTAHIRKLTFPRVGDSSSAYRWSLTTSGLKFDIDMVLFTVGDYGGDLIYIDLAPPPATTVLAFAKAAVSKARTGSTASIPNSVSIVSAPVQTVSTSDGRVGYRAIGSGPPIVLIMGFGGKMETWDPRLVDALAQHHRVIIFDNAGIGQTTALPAPVSADAMAGQTSALITALKLGRPDVLGWSMGSLIAQALAARHPDQVNHLVLCAAYPGDGSTVKPTQAAIDALSSGDAKTVMGDLFPADQTQAGNMFTVAVSAYPRSAPVSASVVAAQRDAVRSWWAGTDAGGQRTGSITAPTLIADGTEDRLDPVANSRRLSSLISGSRLKLFSDAGHAFLFQERASFLATLESFLSS